MDRRTFFLPFVGLFGLLRSRRPALAAAAAAQPIGPREQIREARAYKSPRVLEPGEKVLLRTMRGDAEGRIVRRCEELGDRFAYDVVVTKAIESREKRQGTSVPAYVSPGLRLHLFYSGLDVDEEVPTFRPFGSACMEVESADGPVTICLRHASTVTVRPQGCRIEFLDGSTPIDLPPDQGPRVIENIREYQDRAIGRCPTLKIT
ncbi:MAG TPA: hypothetical protein VGG64_19455 [Pirellulales bacterium]|jgi:hypothetical protein